MAHTQLMAIHLSRRMGTEIAQNYPKIAYNYRMGDTLEKIAKEYGFMEKYALTKAVATNAVYYALHELVSKRALTKLKVSHHLEGCKAAGRKTGRKMYERGLGIHSLTSEQKAASGRNGGRAATLSKGLTPWSDEEKIYLSELCQNPEYQHRFGAQIGNPNYKCIAHELKAKFGTNRTRNSMQSINLRIRTMKMENPGTSEIG